MSSPLGLTILKTDLGNNTYKDISNVNNNEAKGKVASIFNNNKFYINPNGDDGSKKVLYNLNARNNSNNYYTRLDSSEDDSLKSIIDFTKDIPSMRLKPSDFAYLKNVGVYPNNRLIVARRFPAPVPSDITKTDMSPLSTLIGWVPPGVEDSFFKISFNESWQDVSEAGFTNLLNDVGKDISGSFGAKFGDILGSGLNMLPMQGFMEGIQMEVMQRLGLTDRDSKTVPSGDPNIVKASKMRSTPSPDSAFSGVKSDFKVTIIAEYEQKFINGVDPSIVFMDIISNALRFGTSDSTFYLRRGGLDGVSNFIDLLDKGKINQAIGLMVSTIADIMGAIGNQLLEMLVNPPKDTQLSVGDKNAFSNFLKNFIQKTVNSIISKYKVRIHGIITALTGKESTPWHVTIGNPKSPFFCSGDMLCERVEIDFGNVLSFNDLPSTVKITAELSPARPLGAQEIFERFTAGKQRTYDAKLSDYEVKSPNALTPKEQEEINALMEKDKERVKNQIADDQTRKDAEAAKIGMTASKK